MKCFLGILCLIMSVIFYLDLEIVDMENTNVIYGVIFWLLGNLFIRSKSD